MEGWAGDVQGSVEEGQEEIGVEFVGGLVGMEPEVFGIVVGLEVVGTTGLEIRVQGSGSGFLGCQGEGQGCLVILLLSAVG
jgi:hypothetical protein